ncbi:MAG: ATP-binding cassette domain-containing protein [Chromatiales bacterium]|jgi:ATP-binding cassette subfamily F protein 3|nr:ATP-binding cassette domain-containing protein [Chromatiales bacterium]MDX9768372.1 ATP-binding cassette domain-containing protein [Ectothiorhodospiraceae bacterium]
MLNLTDLSLRRGPQALLEHVDLAVHAGWRVGLTGANGTGKSSLFALLRGELHADTGQAELPVGWVIAHVAQETPAVETAAIDYVMAGDEELARLNAELAAAGQTGDGTRLAALHARLEAIDAYTAPSRAARLMAGLGFAPGQESQPVARFSGGWRMRLNLARALMCRSDLLLLDEPTNHLDLDAVLWLEEWLLGYPGTLLLISHDRDFLDRVVTHVAHIENRVLTLYTGNYSAFEQRRAERLAQQEAAHARQAREVAHLQSYIERFRAKATKARQAQSRIKALERMELITRAHVDSPFHFEFAKPERLPHPLLRIRQAAVGYGETPVVRDVNLSLAPGDRLGLLGPNGAGKSTLIRLLAGELLPQGGEYRPAEGLRIGYFAQHQLEQLDMAASPYLHLHRLDPRATEQRLRDFIGGFGFNGDRALEPVGPFSGGEKARLVLALLVYQRPNLLLLDEPTNHLDLDMRDALTLALQDFEGAMVLVSHDRHLLRTVCDRFLLVSDGRAEDFDGDLDDYRQWLASRRNVAAAAAGSAGDNSAAARKDKRREAAEQRNRLKPLRDTVTRLERELDRLHRDQAGLEAEMADSALYEAAARERLAQLLKRQTELKRALDQTETAWIEACEALEAAEAEAA